MIDIERAWRGSRDRFLLEEQLDAVEAFQRSLVDQKQMPDADSLIIRRARILIQVVGGVMLGLNVALLSVFVIFFVLNKMLHFQA